MKTHPSPRPRPVTVDALGARHHNEEIHTAHVTALALQLFDATAAEFGLTRFDRRLLETAARLHDVGYRDHPRDHVAASARIVQRAPLAGLSPTQRAYVAAIIVLHSQRLQPPWRHRLLDRLPNPTRARRLGACLRLADGLDFSHLQDSRIQTVDCSHRVVTVRVRVDHFPGNIAQADRKADLWRDVLPLGVKLVRDRAGLPRWLVPPGTTVPEAARRLLFRQYKIIVVNLPGAIQGVDPEPLHDIRVAIRRLRSLLDVFGDQLGPEAKLIDHQLRDLGRALGPARDLDVWVQFLTSRPVQSRCAGLRAWDSLVARQQAARTRQYATVRRGLQSPAFTTLQRELTWLLRVELPRAARAPTTLLIEPLAAKTLRQTLRRALNQGALRHSPDPADLHRLRVLLRRARYRGEFFAAVLGGRVAKLTRLVHRTEQALARVHDADVALARLRRGATPPPRPLLHLLESRRAQALADAARLWNRLASPRLQTRALARLRHLAHHTVKPVSRSPVVE